jgi:predicted RNA methylase
LILSVCLTSLFFFFRASAAVKTNKRGKLWLRRSQKPVPVFSALLSRSIINPGYTVVIDPCCGTGTSGIAALGLGCAGWLGLDKDASLSDHVVERISTFLQGEAKKEASSKLFYKEQAGKIRWKIFAKGAPTFVIPPTAPEEGIV